MSSMWAEDQKRLEKAKGYIRVGEIEVAEDILEQMQHHVVARQLLRKLRQKHNTNQPKPKAKQGRRLDGAYTPSVQPMQDIPVAALLLIGINMVLVAFTVLATSLWTPETMNMAPLIVLGIIAAGLLLFVVYYLFWRWYWWMLALAWTLGSAAVIYASLAAPRYGVVFVTYQ